ncbi:MAG: hypothetical protein HKN91_16975 [Acidimicrobiia bacterium]|nr:hypothetical protein [Acidimicrobiia bacterium]
MVQSPHKSSGDDSVSEVDDQFRALMEGLRTTIPGVVVLFSFLLILPLQSPFGELSKGNRYVFYAAFASAAAAVVLLIAPSVHQRVRAPISGIRRSSKTHVMFAGKMAIAGTVCFLVSIVTVVYLVSSLVLTGTLPAIATSVIALVAGWAWFYVPIVTFRERPNEDDGDD